MKQRLLKISRETGVSITDITDLLRSNGFDYSEDPAEELSHEAVEFIHNNLAAHIASKLGRAAGARETAKTAGQQAVQDIPLELKIIDRASKEKKLTERIIGFTEYHWYYTVAKYDGECSQPVQFTLFDEVLCDLLLTEEMSFTDLGSVLGLDTEKDPAEREIMQQAIHALRKDKMIQGDENRYSLTEEGRSYAREGVKFSSFARSFELYFDNGNTIGVNAKDIFSKLKSEKSTGSTADVSFDLEQIRNLAEYQAPEIHFPQKGFQLQSAQFIKAANFKAKVWVILLENFKDNTVRAIVYDEKQDRVIDQLSASLAGKEKVIDQLLAEILARNDDIEVTEEPKSSEQLEQERVLINKQDEIEKAIDNQEYEEIEKVRKEIQLVKRHFDSLEFEVELKRLFDETAEDLWVISPWIKGAALKRIPFFEAYLRKGGRVFVAYSEPEKAGDVMAYEEPLNKLLELEKKYLNFYLHQLPPFHYKNVWVRNEQKVHTYYTGSYNILSFFVRQGPWNIRQEKMTRIDWNPEVESEYLGVLKMFGMKYVEKAIHELESLCLNAPGKIDRSWLQKLKTLDNTRLQPFVGQSIAQVDIKHRQLEKDRNEQMVFFKRKYFSEAIDEYRKRTTDMAARPISPDKKRKLQKDFEQLRDEFIDLMDLQLRASSVKDLIDGLQVFSVRERRR